MSTTHTMERPQSHKNGSRRGKAASRAHKPIEQVLQELANQVPQAEWDRLPPDLSDQLDHYLYGWPKQ